MNDKMKITLNRDECIECGACQDNCPEIFMMAEDGKASIIEKLQTNGSSVGITNAKLRTCAQKAAESCPVNIIDVT